MNPQMTIMVQIADPAWTREALHSACVLARKQSATIILVQMIAVMQPSLLGTDLGDLNFSEADRKALDDYQATTEDYGVESSVYLFQYATLADALTEAAENVDAQVVFATLPPSGLPYWRSFQLRVLERHLAQQQRKLITRPVHEASTTPAEIEAASAWAAIKDIFTIF